MKKWNTLIYAIALAGVTSHANAGMFDINLSFNNGITASQQQTFYDAEQFWETRITGYSNTVPEFTLDIDASGEYIDGAGGILGSAGPTLGATYGNHFYALEGGMRFDTDDLLSMESDNSLLSVVIHEMAHVIGFGSLWTYNDIYTPGTGQYTGQAAIAAYQDEFDGQATFVPVELDGGEGTADAHWDETWAGPSSDLMTGYLEEVITISDTTLASFRDLGYTVMYDERSTGQNPVNSADVPTPFAGVGLAGLLGLLLNRRRTMHW